MLRKPCLKNSHHRSLENGVGQRNQGYGWGIRLGVPFSQATRKLLLWILIERVRFSDLLEQIWTGVQQHFRNTTLTVLLVLPSRGRIVHHVGHLLNNALLLNKVLKKDSKFNITGKDLAPYRIGKHSIPQNKAKIHQKY